MTVCILLIQKMKKHFELLYAIDNYIYNLNENNKGDSISLNYNYSFDTVQYSRAFIPSSCFSNYNFIEEEDNYYFIVDGEFLCRHIANNYFDSLDIVISTNHVVLQNNANEIKNGKYIWHVSPEDENFSLRFITSKDVINTNSKYYIIGLSLLLVVCIFFIVRKFKVRKEA